MTGLNADSIRKQIDGRQILNDVFISCRQGEIVGLLGRNGSGKSTLLKIIFGSLSADNKYLSIDNQKINTIYQSRKLLRYLPQDGYLPNHMSIAAIISCFCNKQNAARVMESELVEPFMHSKIKHLSGGEKRILEILLMLHSEAKYILLDEPFNGVSPLYVERIKELIKKHSNDKGFIITDHDYRNLLDISSTVILMVDGNTKVIKEFNDLIDYGYLPATSSKMSFDNLFKVY